MAWGLQVLRQGGLQQLSQDQLKQLLVLSRLLACRCRCSVSRPPPDHRDADIRIQCQTLVVQALALMPLEHVPCTLAVVHVSDTPLSHRGATRSERTIDAALYFGHVPRHRNWCSCRGPRSVQPPTKALAIQASENSLHLTRIPELCFDKVCASVTNCPTQRAHHTVQPIINTKIASTSSTKTTVSTGTSKAVQLRRSMNPPDMVTNTRPSAGTVNSPTENELLGSFRQMTSHLLAG